MLLDERRHYMPRHYLYNVDNVTMAAAPAVHMLPVAASAGAAAAPRHRPVVWVHLHKAAGTWMCTQAKRQREHVLSPENDCNFQDTRIDGPAATGTRAKRLSCSQRRDAYRKLKATWGQIEREVNAEDVRCGFLGVLAREYRGGGVSARYDRIVLGQLPQVPLRSASQAKYDDKYKKKKGKIAGTVGTKDDGRIIV